MNGFYVGGVRGGEIDKAAVVGPAAANRNRGLAGPRGSDGFEPWNTFAERCPQCCEIAGDNHGPIRPA